MRLTSDFLDINVFYFLFYSYYISFVITILTISLYLELLPSLALDESLFKNLGAY